MIVAAVVATTFGISGAAPTFLHPDWLLWGIGVGVCSSVIPYITDQLAMARLPRATFALMLAILPAAATGIGLVVLAQVPTAADLAGIALVIAGVALHAGKRSLPRPRTGRTGGRCRPGRSPRHGPHRAGGPPVNRWRRLLAGLREFNATQLELHERLQLLNRPWEEDLTHWAHDGYSWQLHGHLPPPADGHRRSVTPDGWCPGCRRRQTIPVTSRHVAPPRTATTNRDDHNPRPTTGSSIETDC